MWLIMQFLCNPTFLCKAAILRVQPLRTHYFAENGEEHIQEKMNKSSWFTNGQQHKLEETF